MRRNRVWKKVARGRWFKLWQMLRSISRDTCFSWYFRLFVRTSRKPRFIAPSLGLIQSQSWCIPETLFAGAKIMKGLIYQYGCVPHAPALVPQPDGLEARRGNHSRSRAWWWERSPARRRGNDAWPVPGTELWIDSSGPVCLIPTTSVPAPPCHDGQGTGARDNGER